MMSIFRIFNQRSLLRLWNNIRAGNFSELKRKFKLYCGNCRSPDFPYTLELDQPGKKILLIDQLPPYPEESAGARAVYFHLLALSECGFEVFFFSRQYSPDSEFIESLRKRHINILCGRYIFQHSRNFLAENAKYFDFIWINRPETVSYYWNILKNISKEKLLFFGHDLHFIRLQRQAEVEHSPRLALKAFISKKKEIKIYSAFNNIFCAGQWETDYIHRIFPDKRICNIPIFIDSDSPPPSLPLNERHGLLLVGSFKHAPNIDAVHWLLRELWPGIKWRLPEVRCHIVGQDGSEIFGHYACGDVIFEDHVSDSKLDMLYARCRLVLAPLRYGAGVKGKILEAMAHGIPVVTTTIGAEGINPDGNCLGIADSTEEFVEMVKTIYNDSEKWQELSKHGKQLLQKDYSMNTLKQIFKHIFCADIKK